MATFLCFVAAFLLCFGSFVRSVEIRLQTFNVALTPRIPHMKTRTEALVPALRHSDSDIICLQEVWFSDELQYIVEGTKDKYPYHMASILNSSGSLTEDVSWPPCFGMSTLTFSICSWRDCVYSKSEAEALKCAITCGLFQQTHQCIACIIFTGQRGLSRCFISAGYAMNTPGLLLLSKRPLSNTKIVNFFPGTKQLVHRAFYKAMVSGLGEVVCTHLTSIEGLYTDNLFNNWQEQSLNESGQIVKDIINKNPIVIMGDLNSGPGSEENDLSGDVADTYSSLVSSDLASPYVDQIGTCTFCMDNVLCDYTNNWITDHILVRGHNVTDTQLLYNEDIKGEVFPLSDHYGVEITVTV